MSPADWTVTVAAVVGCAVWAVCYVQSVAAELDAAIAVEAAQLDAERAAQAAEQARRDAVWERREKARKTECESCYVTHPYIYLEPMGVEKGHRICLWWCPTCGYPNTVSEPVYAPRQYGAHPSARPSSPEGD